MGLQKSWSDLATKQQNQHHFWEQILPQLSLWVCWRLCEILKIFLATSAVSWGSPFSFWVPKLIVEGI